MKLSSEVATIERESGESMDRTSVQSGYPFEAAYGYSRAIRVGSQVFVSGTTARAPDLDADVAVQLRGATSIAVSALQEAGAELRHVVRTVVYVLDLDDLEAVARVHGETFGKVRPASTLVQVAALTPKKALIEIEMTAVIDETPNGAIRGLGNRAHANDLPTEGLTLA